MSTNGTEAAQNGNAEITMTKLMVLVRITASRG
jgi:hypothetical protein